MSSFADAVFSACKYGRLEDVEDLLGLKEANWNLKDELGNSPLHYAAGAGHVEIVKRLVASGKVDVNAVNGRGDSALHKVRNVQEKFQVALKHSDNHVMVAAVLVEEGKIDILLKNADGKCAFEIATNSEMKAACEPYVAIDGYDPEADADAAAAEEDEEDEDDEDEE